MLETGRNLSWTYRKKGSTNAVGETCVSSVRQTAIARVQNLRVDSPQGLFTAWSAEECVMKNEGRTKENTMWKLVSGTILYHKRLGTLFDFRNLRRTMFSRYNT